MSVADDHGVSEDEVVGIDMVYWNRDLISRGASMPWIYRYDGTVFNFFAEGVFQTFFHPAQTEGDPRPQDLPNQASPIVSSGREPATSSAAAAEAKRRLFLARIQVKHGLTFLVSLIAYACVAALVGIGYGRRFAWLGAITLVLLPRFWGHAFFNFKDIPFAALFTLCTLLGVRLVERLLPGGETVQPDRRALVFTAAYGGLIGLLTGLRLAGCVVLVFFAAAFVAARGIGREHLSRDLGRFGIVFAVVGVFWLLTTIAVYPAAWADPLAWFAATSDVLAQYPFTETVLYCGRDLAAQSLPWHYLPVWLLITCPALVLVCCAGGLLVALRRFPTASVAQRACLVMVLLQAGLIPLIAVARGSTMYDGLRHFLFVLPAMAFFAALFVAWLFDRVRRRAHRLLLAAVLGLLSLPTLADMIATHPYTYAYFNRVSGGFQDAVGRFDTEYWGLSMRSGMEWLNRHAERGARVVVAGPLHSASAFLEAELELIHYRTEAAAAAQMPFYYLARPRWHLTERHPGCRVVHRVECQGAPLTVVKHCP